jgi:hypothetical protein
VTTTTCVWCWIVNNPTTRWVDEELPVAAASRA